MLTPEGCKQRRTRLFQQLQMSGPLLLGDPLNLRYFANCYLDPFSIGVDFGGLLLVQPDGHATLYHDHRAPKSVELAWVDELIPVKWYDGKSPGQGPRRLILRDVVDHAGTNGLIHDQINDPTAPDLWRIVTGMRRSKDPDEVALLKACMRVAEAGHAWARANVQPGMTELNVYNGILQACSEAAGHPVILYGDFTVSSGASTRGGPPTQHTLQVGEMLILDFSVIIQGYRSDFTNTLVIGGRPIEEQNRLLQLCAQAMKAGEQQLRAGTTCQTVYDSVRDVFAVAGVATAFPHHAGHGLGISHPEPPFFVEYSTETLIEGDVVTLEPGLYIDGIGGLRIEHNYLITASGFEQLSNHTISLT